MTSRSPLFSLPAGDALALVTGASRGLGFALSTQLARRGHPVVMVAKDDARLAASAAAVQRETGGEVYTLARDLALRAHNDALVTDAVALAGAPVRQLFLNASSLGPLPMPLLADLPRDALRDVLEVNLAGPHAAARAALGHMVLHNAGRIVFISSDAAVNAYPHWGAYGVSKAAIDHLARSLAAELADTAVRVVAVDPGEMNTDMHRDAIPDADVTALRKPQDVAAAILRDLDDPAAEVRYAVQLGGAA